MKKTFQSEDLMVVLDGISDAVVKLDGKANYVAMNKAAEDTFQRLGKDPRSMIGKSVWEMFPEVKGTLVERNILRALEDDASIKYEYYYSIDQRWYETQGYPSSPGVILVFRDITDRKAIS
jgi:PAS domain S-box-containing protein